MVNLKLDKSETKRQILLCNKMITLHKLAKGLSHENAVSVWSFKKKALQHKLINT